MEKLKCENLTCFATNEEKNPGEYLCENSMFVSEVDFKQYCKRCTGIQLVPGKGGWNINE